MARLRWLIAQNTPPPVIEKFQIGSRDIQILPGQEFDPDKQLPASYHHGASLNAIVRMAQTRFLLVTDPDFYIIRNEWVVLVLAYMQEIGLAFLGVPWHPKWYYKHRYFPCAHCLFIDLAQVNKDELDFRPGQAEPGLIGSKTLWQRVCLALEAWGGFNLRRSIGSSQDTGYRLYRRFNADPRIKAECMIPVYKPEVDYQLRPRRLNQWLDAMMPDHLSFTPKRAETYTKQGFGEFGLPDVTRYGWEEFIWRDTPFGFHVRGVISRLSGSERLLTDLTTVLAKVT